MNDEKFSLIHTQPTKQKNNKLWCCANSAIELVDTVKTNTQTKEKRIKQLPETTQQMVVEIFLQSKAKQNWEDTNQEVTEKSHRKREIETNKKHKTKKGGRLQVVPYERKGDETETNAHVIERKGKW